MGDLINYSGVYRITCSPTGKTYIGSAKRFKARWSLHKVQLRQGKHHSPHLQNAWDKHGQDAFVFEILLVCAPEMAVFYEQVFIDAVRPEFNICQTAGSNLGLKHSPRSRQKMSQVQRDVRPKYEWKGRQRCLTDIAEIEGCDQGLLIARVLGLGKTVQEAVKMGESRVRLHEHEGRHQNLSAWAREIGVHVARLNHYIKRGLTVGEAKRLMDAASKSISFSEFCKLNSANITTAKSRIKNGMSVMEAITRPVAETGIRCRNTGVA